MTETSVILLLKRWSFIYITLVKIKWICFPNDHTWCEDCLIKLMLLVEDKSAFYASFWFNNTIEYLYVSRWKYFNIYYFLPAYFFIKNLIFLLSPLSETFLLFIHHPYVVAVSDKRDWWRYSTESILTWVGSGKKVKIHTLGPSRSIEKVESG